MTSLHNERQPGRSLLRRRVQLNAADSEPLSGPERSVVSLARLDLELLVAASVDAMPNDHSLQSGVCAPSERTEFVFQYHDAPLMVLRPAGASGGFRRRPPEAVRRGD